MCSSVLFIPWYAMLITTCHIFLLSILIAPQILVNKPSSYGKTLGFVNSQHSHKSKTTTNLLIQTSQSKVCHKLQTFVWYTPFTKKNKEVSRSYRLNCKICFSTHCTIKITKITSSQRELNHIIILPPELSSHIASWFEKVAGINVSIKISCWLTVL